MGNLNYAKVLRKNITEAEKLLWFNIRAKRFEKIKFKRQVPIGKYIVDFVSHSRGLVIELDGGQHAKPGIDEERDVFLENQGYNVLRFWNNEVFDNLEGVLETIELELKKERV